MKRISFAIGAGLLTAVSPVSVTAQTADPTITAHINVRHGDLDLTGKSGAETMLRRLDKAATKVCGGKPAPVMSWDQVAQAKQREHRKCKAEAIGNATLKLDAPLVRAAWLSKAKTIHYAANAN
jgi:UrcA family protein